MKNKLQLNLKSKKGFSLLELLCAIMIIAIVVGATATGLAVSYKSITLGGEKDRANARAQEYCDIVMTYVENAPITLPFDCDFYTFSDSTKGQLNIDIADITCYTTKTDLNTRTKRTDDVYYTIEEIGTVNSATSYEITVYVDYTSENTTYCKGTVTKS